MMHASDGERMLARVRMPQNFVHVTLGKIVAGKKHGFPADVQSGLLNFRAEY